MTEESKDPSLKDSARRKLVRGAFAAPAVLTLHNGSAFAASSAARCLVNRNLNPISPVVANADDAWFRYQLWVVRKMANMQVESYWIKGAELSAYVRASQTPFLLSGSWQQFAITSNLFLNPPIASQPSFNPINEELRKTGPWVVLRVNGQGAIVGAGASGSGSAVGDSCWNSFAI